MLQCGLQELFCPRGITSLQCIIQAAAAAAATVDTNNILNVCHQRQHVHLPSTGKGFNNVQPQEAASAAWQAQQAQQAHEAQNWC
jgi:hypothetical protein